MFQRSNASSDVRNGIPKLAARQAKAKASGKKPGGQPPTPPVAGPGPSDQVNLTDADSRIMPVAGGGFEQCYNAQAVVAADSLLVVAVDVVQAANDKQQVAPMLRLASAHSPLEWRARPAPASPASRCGVPRVRQA